MKSSSPLQQINNLTFMPLNLEIVTPEGKIYSQTIDSVVLPTLNGEIGILPGHIPLLTMLNPGELKVSHAGHEESLAIDKGFVRVLGDTVSVLTEAAIEIAHIDIQAVEEAERRAQKALEEARFTKQIDPAEIERLEAIARFAIAQKLTKQRKL